eukprot:15448082-Alexandrium_andersonii.AAC.1
MLGSQSKPLPPPDSSWPLLALRGSAVQTLQPRNFPRSLRRLTAYYGLTRLLPAQRGFSRLLPTPPGFR